MNKEELLQKYYPGIADYSPEVAEEVMARSKEKCEASGCKKSGASIHHIVGKRRVAFSNNLILLCLEHHGVGKTGIHGYGKGKELRLKVRRQLQQEYFDMGFTKDEVIYLMGSKSGMLY